MSRKLGMLALVLVACGGTVTPLPQVPPTPLGAFSTWQEPPPVAPEPELGLEMAVRRVTLDNGLSVTVVTREGNSPTALRLWLPSAADRSVGPVAVMSDALRAGTRVDANTVLVNPRLAYEPIHIDTRATGTTFSWQVLTRGTEAALGILGHFVFHPAFEPLATRERFQASLTRIQNHSVGLSHLADIARGALPGLELPTPEHDARGIFKLTPEALARVHRCVMSPAGAELVVAGPLGFEQVEPWARAAFGSIAAQPSDPSCAEFSVPPLSARSVKAEQIQLGIVYGGAFDPIAMMSMPGPAPSSPEYLPFSLLAEVLEARDVGSAQGLRHMGATYGIHFTVNDTFPGLSLLEVQGQIDQENIQMAVRQVIEDIRSLADTLSEDQLDEVKRRWRNGYVNALANNGALATAALGQIRRGQPPEALGQWPNELMKISVEQCRATARNWFADAQPSIAVAGLPGKLVRGLNLSARIRAMRWTKDLQEHRKL